ncbi:hypothetical protein MLD38_030514 [Melastoma candidum]|uniref:Uncharacterized protein n=1 Tax=Melastoma candidum TaxID=119954 RepID=A0ACB9MLU9_9MYRT|nr:hypothetical protein MLD38_030514 [Melastoma candidum]
MGNCIANNRVMSREADEEGPRTPFTEVQSHGADVALKQGGGGGGSIVKKKNKMEKRVSFKLEDDGKEQAVGGEKRGDLRNGKGATRRVKVVVTKEELRRILEYAERSSRPGSSSSLEELIMSLRSSRSGGRACSNGGGDVLSPGLECIPEHRH